MKITRPTLFLIILTIFYRCNSDAPQQTFNLPNNKDINDVIDVQISQEKVWGTGAGLSLESRDIEVWQGAAEVAERSDAHGVPISRRKIGKNGIIERDDSLDCGGNQSGIDDTAWDRVSDLYEDFRCTLECSPAFK